MRQRLPQQRLGGRRLDHLDAVGRLNREIRREQRDVGAAAAGLLGERNAHPARRAVADKTHGVQRLAGAACRDENLLAGEIRRREQLLDAAEDVLGSDIRPRPDSPSASSPSSGPINSTSLSSRVRTFACVAGCAHMRWFIAGATSTGPRCASAASVRTLSAIPCASFASVFAVHGATTSRSACSRCGYGSSLAGRRASAANVFGGDELLRAARDQRDHVVPGLDEQPRQLARLVGRDAAGYAEEDASHTLAFCLLNAAVTASRTNT